jgi:serine/threonine protein kinase
MNDMGTPYAFWLFNPERQVKYFAISLIDEGGFGQVWYGVTAEGLPIAIKIIKPTADYIQDFSTWFTDQQVHLMCLNHTYIVTTFDQFVSTDGKLVLVMEHGGGSLESMLNQQVKFTNKSICAIATQILAALHYIHNLNVVHRDVTLKNIIWFNGGIFKLCDFGISKPNVQPGEYARTFIGHKSYIAPELLYAGHTTHQSDIYQLGLVLLTLKTGKHPIPLNATTEQTRQMILDGIPRRIADSLIATHGRIAEIISIMLRRHDVYRFSNAMEAWKEFEKEFKNQENIEQIINSLTKPMGINLPPWLLDNNQSQTKA